jgi:hypothetical protein
MSAPSPLHARYIIASQACCIIAATAHGHWLVVARYFSAGVHHRRRNFVGLGFHHQRSTQTHQRFVVIAIVTWVIAEWVHGIVITHGLPIGRLKLAFISP